MARTLSLHHLTALDADPAQFVEIAARLDCRTVALFTHGRADRFPLLTAENEGAVGSRLRDLGVALHNVEYAAITPEMAWEGLADALARSARLGARRMTVHCHDPEEARAVQSFGRLCELAAGQDMSVGLEWTAVNAVINSLATAERFIAQAGQPNGDLVADLLHLTRSGGTPGDLARLPPGRIGYAQISDGPLRRDLAEYAELELIRERLPPGDGELPVADFIAALPAEIVVDVEAPQATAWTAGASALERAGRAVTAARRFLP
ncbi:MAG: xylose isomerase [Phenylobacterium sp.]|nr:xylose isomerase [Phenylobacterium sp.]